MTLDIVSAVADYEIGPRNWIGFTSCRACRRPSLFKMYGGSLSDPPSAKLFAGQDLTNIFQAKVAPPIVRNSAICPQYVPEEISRLFAEAALCLAFSAFDASGAMFRKTIDAATRSKIGIAPESVEKGNVDYISWKTAKDLRLRLDWLFDRGKLPSDLKDLVSCVHQDGNDAAHSVHTIGEAGALDLQDFTTEILEVLFTRPGQIAANVERRDARRA